MPATPTGRGAQVIVDPGSLTAKAIRGSYASTMEGNLAKVRSDRLAGTFASGDTTLDGTTLTGGVATDPMMASKAPQIIYQSNIAVSHTGDTASFLYGVVPVPAQAMGPNGQLRITTLWSFTGSTSKTVVITFSNTSGSGGSNLLSQAIVAQQSFNDVRHVRNSGAVNAQRLFPPNTSPYAPANPAVVSAAINTDAPCYVNLLGTLTAAGESITLEGCLVEVLRLN